MSTIKHYLSVYKEFISTSVSVETSFRTSYILVIIMDFLFFFTSLLSAQFIFNHVEHIGPWNRSQFLFFMAFMLTIDNIHMMIFSQNFWALSFNIKSGELDYVILKPLSTIFNVFFRLFRSSSLINTPVYIGFLIYYGIEVGLYWYDWPLIPIFLIMGLTLLVLIEFILSCSMFWVTEGNGINFLRMQLQGIARWPHVVYTNMVRKFFLIAVPVLFIGSAPVEFLFDKGQWMWIVLMMGLILILSLILSWIWKEGLKRYDSASS
jgi:ABC-2 type transport system permease protein